jgi:SAM-dependent methyltransferase
MNSSLTIDDPAYFAHLASIEERHWWALGMWRLAAYWLRQMIDARKGLAALDVGCGTGLILRRLGGLTGIGSAVGIEPDSAAIAHGRKRELRSLVRGTALALPFPDQSFDIVTCFDVFQHLGPDGDTRAAREIHRVLRPGGVAVIRANGRGWARIEPGIPQPYTLELLTERVQAAGLQVVRATYANCLPAILQELRGRLPGHGRSPLRSHPAGGGLQIQMPPPWINRWMGRISAAEALLAGRLNRKLPFGHSTLVLGRRTT